MHNMQHSGKNKKEYVYIITHVCRECLWKDTYEIGKMVASGRNPVAGDGVGGDIVFPFVPAEFCVSNICSKTFNILKGFPRAFSNCTATSTPSLVPIQPRGWNWMYLSGVCGGKGWDSCDQVWSPFAPPGQSHAQCKRLPDEHRGKEGRNKDPSHHHQSLPSAPLVQPALEGACSWAISSSPVSFARAGP